MQEKPTKGKIIVFGILFFYPLAGVTYQFLHYLLGLRRLGYDPYYVEDSSRWIYNPKINDMTGDASGNIAMVVPQLEAHGFGDRWCFRGKYDDGQCYGMAEGQLEQLYRDADGFLNVTGAQELREEHLAIKRRIYVESDPFRMQVKVAQGDAGAIEQLAMHDAHFTFGENLGAADSLTPIEQFNWLPTRQPVVMDLWTNPFKGGEAYNTITTWSNKDRHIEYKGETYYWTKDREFLKFIDLPTRRNVPFEMAVGVEGEARALLEKNRWRLGSSVGVSQSIDSYRAYIQQSRGEFTVARDQYVRPRTGWFSDRTACYLAAGRPTITQETGFNKYLPTGNGLYGFTTMDDVLAAVDAIESDYEGNCRVAREIAEEYFAAEKVVGSVMERAGF
ncbi:MAG: hypothetical protein M3X11_02510 [Acidobacteriota bacterium]|nr:hypothetical protein [Acidobacteriota bacterium]